MTIWNALKKGLIRKYNAIRVKHDIEDVIKTHDLLPHDDEWLQIVKQFNTNLGTKCVEEAPIEYKLRIESSLISRSNRPFYSAIVDCYWRTYTKKNGEIVKRDSKNPTAITSVMEFRYDPLNTKPRVIKVGLRAKSIDDNKWTKRLSKVFNQTPEIDDKGNAVFVFG